MVIGTDSSLWAFPPVRALPRLIVEGVVFELFPSMTFGAVHVEFAL